STQDQHIEWQPDRAAPVRVAAEHTGVGFGGGVFYFVPLAMKVEWIRGVLLPLGQGPDAKGGEEAVLIEHPRPDGTQFCLITDAEQVATFHAWHIGEMDVRQNEAVAVHEIL